MRIRMVWKDPEAIGPGIDRALKAWNDQMIPPREAKEVRKKYESIYDELVGLGFGEFMMIEYDTESGELTLSNPMARTRPKKAYKLVLKEIKR